MDRLSGAALTGAKWLTIIVLILFLLVLFGIIAQSSIVPCEKGKQDQALVADVTGVPDPPKGDAKVKDVSSARGCLSSDLDIGVD